MSTTETKHEKFLRVTGKRTEKMVEAIRILGNCSNKGNYDYTPQDVETLFNTIETALDEAKQKYAKYITLSEKNAQPIAPSIVEKSVEVTLPTATNPKEEAHEINDIHVLLKTAYYAHCANGEYMNVAKAGTILQAYKPDFDPQNYGYNKLSQLLESFPDKYQVRRECTIDKPAVVYFKYI